MSYSWKAPVRAGVGSADKQRWHARAGRTFELLLKFSAAGDAERADELLEVDLAALVGVKDVEDVVCELAGVAEREELLVYPAETRPCRGGPMGSPS